MQSTMVYDYNDGNMPSWARTAVQAAQDYGALVGDEQGDWDYLIRTYELLCVNTVVACIVNNMR